MSTPAAIAWMLSVNRDQVMHLAEQPGQPLHLVDHDPTSRGASLDGTAKRLDGLKQREIVPIQQQIEPQGSAQLLAQPCGLACASRAEQEEGVVRPREIACIHRGHFSMDNARDAIR